MGAPVLSNPAAVTVSVAAVVVAAANARRRRLIIQQTSANPVRVGGASVTAATGIHLGQNERLEFSGEDVPTEAIYAIREGATDGTVVVLEYAEA